MRNCRKQCFFLMTEIIGSNLDVVVNCEFSYRPKISSREDAHNGLAHVL